MFYKYPYTNLYNLNLDWLIQAIREIQDIIAPLEGGLVNSVNGMTGDVIITKAMLIQILENLVSTFNGRTGDVVLTAEDVNSTLIDNTWTSDPGDTIADLTQTALDDLYQSGKRVLIFVNSQGVADRIYFLQYYDSHAQAQELATVASFNGRSGNVTLTAADVNGTMIELIWASDPGDTIGDLSQEDLDAMYLSGKRVLLFANSQGIAEQVYFLLYYGGHAQPQVLAVVPASRTVNGKALASNITINSSDIPSLAISGASSVETALMSLNVQKVPTTRTVNGKALSVNITVYDEDIPSEVVAGQTTVAGVLTNLNQRATTQAQQINGLKAAAAYVEDGDTATQKTYTDGEFILWRNALYKVRTGGIPINTQISGHVNAVTGGGLNNLFIAINDLNAKLTTVETASFEYNTDFEMYAGKIINRAALAGEAKGNLAFDQNASMIIFGGTANLHILCMRSNGELYTRNKISSNWETEWTKRW